MMKTVSKTLYFLLLVIIFSCAKEQNNPYDRDCPPEIWSPTNLNSSIGSGGVVLSWEQEATHFGGFLLERSADSINWLQVNSSLIDKSKRTYTDSENLPGGKVYYRLSAKADKNQSNFSYAKAICIVPPVPGTISGKTTVQENEAGVSYSITAVSGVTGYNWTIPTGASFVSGQGTTGIKVNFGTTGGNVSVRTENNCGNSVYTNLAVTTCQLPEVPGAISGKTTVQENEAGVSYSITAVNGATGYNWTIPTGASFVSGQGTTGIKVNFGTTGGNVSVRTENSCGNSVYTNLAVITCKLPAVPGAISGKTTVQENEAGVSYSITAVNGATGYNWTIPTGASFVSGQGTTGIKVNFGTTGGNVSVRSENSCGNSVYTHLAVITCKLPAVPGAISGKTTVPEKEAGVSYSITAVNAATRYNWTIPTGASFVSGQGTTGIIVNFGTTGGNVSVRSENSCGNSVYTHLAVTTCQLPAVPGTITGKTTVQQNEIGVTFSIAAVSGATSYNWTIPAGASFISGQGTNSIKVNFGTTGGNIGVCSVNNCGNSDFIYQSICVLDFFIDPRDGIPYKFVQIGTQVWMAENLKSTKYNDGTIIPLVTDDGTWWNLTAPAYCWYTNDQATYGNTYGALYNWYAVNTGKLCPAGWHVPTDAEWTTLSNFLGGEIAAGGKMKGVGITHWTVPNTGATNESCFSALPGGHRYDNGWFFNVRGLGYWWSSTEFSTMYAWSRYLAFDGTKLNRTNDYGGIKSYGLSIRCLRD